MQTPKCQHSLIPNALRTKLMLLSPASKTSENNEPKKVPQMSDESGSNYVYVIPNKPDHKKTSELPETTKKAEGSTLNYVQVDLKPRCLASPLKTSIDEDKSYSNAKEFVAVVS